MLKNKILLFGPKISSSKNINAYGGGTGGYTRNMMTYLNFLKFDEFEIIPGFHSIRGQFKVNSFVFRFIYDSFKFIFHLIKVRPKIIHVMAQYRTAFPREFFVFFISKVFGFKILYEIKAGAFFSWLKSTNRLTKKSCLFMLRNVDKILVEGKSYKELLLKEYSLKSVYFPNFIPNEIIPAQNPPKLDKKLISILFIGYCYEGKGVYELVNACQKIAESGYQVCLNLVGFESEAFSKWIDKKDVSFELVRHGLLPYDRVLESFDKNDIYCYPSKHPGEGHNNTINEAMMKGMVILSSKQGFLGDIITDEIGYSISKVDYNILTKVLIDIVENRDKAKQKAILGYNTLKKNYNSLYLNKKLDNIYKSIINENYQRSGRSPKFHESSSTS